ncbi:MAG TPA: DUF3306 domain-containing protein [Afipia sp.]|uniref:DUF3306 domain-containing protein n=1 Tax=unclassified Afipia TaxID=2642050 RepID=UPI00046779A0|nr:MULTISPECIES: DUF3306 domain-containing protein [unclassified Afipia]MAH72386.1 DUF3306 domain-containing protein [Afipia sp.]OUX58479.1 MAG: hypothetical protein CBB64_24565 [Afipia sp. TMED4]HAO43752.1 DUF3306 domain-containing protein [Afipia sp.]HAP13341.1 DUF3306 domain-containing protein [Afipia sp.]HAQ91973.1 DUF3306 domain-containing protein [Afipia sp.]
MSKNEKDTEKSFLSRWSQRKQDAKQPETDGTAEGSAKEGDAAPAPVVEGDAEEFDLSSLPKLEEITETTDITGFLRKGVPESLRNAALRKSWALDPAIRNYVNPALDYAYDWNTPGGVPGNSEIAAGTDIAKMVLQIMGGESSSAQQSSDTLPHSDAPAAASDDSGIALQNSEADLPLQQVRVSAPSSTTTPVAADFKQTEQDRIEIAQAVDETSSNASQHQVRRHGSAKPRI